MQERSGGGRPSVVNERLSVASIGFELSGGRFRGRSLFEISHGRYRGPSLSDARKWWHRLLPRSSPGGFLGGLAYPSLRRIALAMRLASWIGGVTALGCLAAPGAGWLTGGGSVAAAYLVGILSICQAVANRACVVVIDGHIALSARRRASIATGAKQSGGTGDLIVGLSMRAMFVLLYLLYPDVSSLIFSAFSCTSFDDGTRYLKRHLTSNCDSPTHALWEVYAVVMIFVYPLGVPCLYAAMLWVYHRQLSRVRRVQELLRRMGHEGLLRGREGSPESHSPDRLAAGLERAHELSPPAVLLHVNDGSDAGGVQCCLGLYRREGEWGGLPAFRHAQDPDLWLVSMGSQLRWIVQRSHQRGSGRGFLSLTITRSPLHAPRWKRHEAAGLAFWPSLSCHLLHAAELAVWNAPAVLIHVHGANDAAAEQPRLGLYRREGEWGGRPAFRHAHDPDLWLVSSVSHRSWLVQRTGQRGTLRGFLGLAVAGSPLRSVRWKRCEASGWVYFPSLRCQAVDATQLGLLLALSEARGVMAGLKMARAALTRAVYKARGAEGVPRLGSSMDLHQLVEMADVGTSRLAAAASAEDNEQEEAAASGGLFEEAAEADDGEGGDGSSSAARGEEALKSERARAHSLFAHWHQRLGLEIDSTSKQPVIRHVWPVFFFHPHLSEREEALGFLAFQAHRDRTLRAKAANGERLSQRELEFLQSLTEAEMLRATHGLASPTGGAWGLWTVGGSRWDWDAPGQAEWEAMPMAERVQWVPEGKRDVPEAGDQLLFIDGQAAPEGERGEDGERFDHSATYEMLEHAGVTTLEEEEMEMEALGEEEVEGEAGQLGSAGKGGKARVDIFKVLRRLRTLWARRIAKLGTGAATEGLEGAVGASTYGLELAINDYVRTAPQANLLSPPGGGSSPAPPPTARGSAPSVASELSAADDSDGSDASEGDTDSGSESDASLRVGSESDSDALADSEDDELQSLQSWRISGAERMSARAVSPTELRELADLVAISEVDATNEELVVLDELEAVEPTEAERARCGAGCG